MTNKLAERSSYSIYADAAKCTGCMICMLRCSFRLNGKFNLATARIQIKRLIGQVNEFEITFIGECDGCGICAGYCPYGALTRKQGEE